MANVIIDLHGMRARNGVDLDAFEAFVGHFRSTLREYARAAEGTIARKGGRPAAREAAASAFRLVEFHTGSGVATLEPRLRGAPEGPDLLEDDEGGTLAVATLRQLLQDVETESRLPEPVIESLSSARRAMGDDGSFGVTVNGAGPSTRVLIDEERMMRLQTTELDPTNVAVNVTGRLHMIEADPPNRRVAVRAQDGTDWNCTYPDRLHPLVTTLIERIVQITGVGRRVTSATGRLRIEELEPVPEPAQDSLFTVETVPLDQLHAEQQIEGPQGLGALIDREWEDDDESRLFLEATLGTAPPHR